MHEVLDILNFMSKNYFELFNSVKSGTSSTKNSLKVDQFAKIELDPFPIPLTSNPYFGHGMGGPV